MASRWEILSKKLEDAGGKTGELEQTAPKSNEKYYPSIHLTDKEVSGLKNLEMGDEVRLIATGKVRGTNQYNDEPKSYDIELQKIAVAKGGD